MAILVISILKNNQILNSIFNTSIEQENEAPLFSYMVYDNQNEQNVKVLITLNSENGIEYLEYPNGKVLYGNGKNTVAIDYVTSKNDSTVFKVKEEGKNVKEERMVITDEIIENTVNVAKIAENPGYKTIQISSNINLNGFKTYYKIGKTEVWTEGKGKVPILDYDVTTNELINNDETITITAMVKNNNTGDTVSISRNYVVDTNATMSNFEADSLLNAMEKYDFGTGKFKVKVSDETYDLKVYSFDEDLDIDVNTEFGTEEDVGAANKYAQNMIVLKVNGNLTVNEGAMLTAYASRAGYGGPKGMMIYCTGTLTNNGTISMTARGAYAEGQNVYLWKNADGSYETVPAVGGAGGIIPTTKKTRGRNGGNGTERQTGGGGSGATHQWNYPPSGNGSAGTSFSGGSGGGGQDAANSGDLSGNAENYGGKGGDGSKFQGGQSGGGGAGNPGGFSSFSSARGENGTGGLLIIYGNNVKNNSKIMSKGSNGKSANAPGGSSGGGSINIFYKENCNSGNMNVDGGASISSYYSSGGGAGGTGSISIGTISTGSYQSTSKNY